MGSWEVVKKTVTKGVRRLTIQVFKGRVLVSKAGSLSVRWHLLPASLLGYN